MRNTFFFIGACNRWPYHFTSVFKRLKKEFKLPWVRIRIAYHNFPNFKALLTSLVNGRCIWNRKCNNQNIVYKITCQCCQMYYIGNTSRSFKERTNKHVGDIRNYVINDEQSLALAEHFGNHI